MRQNWTILAKHISCVCVFNYVLWKGTNQLNIFMKKKKKKRTIYWYFLFTDILHTFQKQNSSILAV